MLPVPEAGAGLSWFVRSEYQSLMPGQSKTTVVWQFDRQLSADGDLKLLVYDRDNKVRCRAEFFFVSEGALVQADCYREVRGLEICDAKRYVATDPVLLTQTLIPGDWLNGPLPFVFDDEINTYTVRELIGTTTFTSHLKTRQKSISYNEAVATGMLKPDLQADEGKKNNLRLVRVARLCGDREEVVLEQLWAEGDIFWLYEAKNERQSWRLADE